MTNSRIKAIIFDCDGTLVNSEVPTAELITEILLRKNYAASYKEIYEISRGKKLASLAQELKLKFASLNTAEFIDIYSEEILTRLETYIEPDLDTVSLIANLPVKKCVATNGSLQRTEIVLKASGLLSYFKNRIVSAHEINAWKPDPKIILYSSILLGCSPEECLLIDDSIDGLKAGIAAGAQVASFKIPTEKLGELQKLATQIDDLSDVLRLL